MSLRYLKPILYKTKNKIPQKGHFWHNCEIPKFEGQPYWHFPLKIHETVLVSLPYYFNYAEFFWAPQICLLLSYGLVKLVLRNKKSNVKTSHEPLHELQTLISRQPFVVESQTKHQCTQEGLRIFNIKLKCLRITYFDQQTILSDKSNGVFF